MSTVVLIRPGCTDFDEQNRIQGSLDLPLNKRGEEQVQQMITELRPVSLEIIYTSPSEPARTTAANIGAELGIPVRELEGLRNLDQGLWQGLRVDEIRHKHPKVFKQWQELPDTICPPQGEMVPAALDRIRRALEKPVKRGISFAIVASEPLATLIGCVVTGCKPDLTDAVCNPTCAKNWEYLSQNGKVTAALDSPTPDSNPVMALVQVHREEQSS